MKSPQPEVLIYTDGGADPNPGVGGYGVVLISGRYRKELSAGYRFTTNNRMELLAVITGLEALKKPSRVTVFSDSKYIVDAVSRGSVSRWQANGWMRTPNHKAKNADLWERLLMACESHDVTFQWVPGHQGIIENERCDQLASRAAKAAELLDDIGYPPTAPPTNPMACSPPRSVNNRVRQTAAGEPCRHCSTPLIRRSPKRKKRKPGQEFYYEWYLYCPGCRRMYMVEEGKRRLEEDGPLLNAAADSRAY